ncbi:MAG: hypothetical protein C0404_14710 [Verrucomicrobia bacterium]|nr:hypothetical protein [Verrucomicrobiota bacterium]
MKFWTRFAFALAGAITLGALTSSALINPNFTPINLISESQWIIAVTAKKTDKDGIYEATIQTVLKEDKSKSALKTVTLDFTKALNAEMKQFLVDLVMKSGPTPAILFLGKFNDPNAQNDGGAPAEGGETKAFLHAGGKWVDLIGAADGKNWGLVQINSHMEGTWAGSSDMLLKAINYTLKDPTADFPVKSGSQFIAPVKIGTVDGLLRTRPVDLAGNGKWSLLATSAKGDRLYSYDAAAKAMKDVTAAKKLSSKSAAFCWADFNADGKIDLASFDGKALSIFAQQADGTFLAQPVALAADALAKCSALAPVSTKDKVGLLISGATAPVIVKDVLAKEPKAESLAEGGLKGDALGKSAESIVADFDGDAIPDVMALFEKASLFYKGKGEGVFLPAVKCDVGTGTGAYPACLADFDGDGRLDVFCVSDDGARIWQNEGEAKFSEWIRVSGEIAYISKPNGGDCFTGDMNNDGKQDVLITYTADNSAQIFFNRGFRSFGHAHDLDVQENQLLPSSEAAQKTGCLGDFNADGAHDMVLGLPNGEVWVFTRDTADSQSLAAIVSLAAKDALKGPVNVTGWSGDRCMGAWSVLPGVTEAFFGTKDAGPITVKWQLPGGAAQKKDIQVDTKPKRFELK